MRIGSSALVALVVTLLASSASASDSIVIEAYSGARPTDADDWLGPTYAALESSGSLSGAALVARVEQMTSRGVRALSGNEIIEAQRNVDRAYGFLVDGAHAAAATEASKALALFAIAPWQLSKETALRDAQFKALLILARAHDALGHSEEAFRAAAEAHRTFPERQVNTLQFDPRVKSLHRRVGDELVRQGTGTLEVRIDDPSATIFVNERFVGAGVVVLRAVAPGSYRVLVARGNEPGRVHDVRVNAGETAVRSLTWDFESLVRIDDGRVVLRSSGGALTALEIALAVRLGRELEAKTVTILGIRAIDGRRTVIGYSISVDSQRRVYGAVSLEPVGPTGDVLGRLGALLAGNAAVDTTDIALREPAPPRVAEPAAPRRWHQDTWAWGFAAAGVVAGASAGALVWSSDDLTRRANDEPEQGHRRELRDRADRHLQLGSAVSVVAAGLLVTGVVKLLAHEGSDEGVRERAITFTASGHSFAMGGRF